MTKTRQCFWLTLLAWVLSPHAAPAMDYAAGKAIGSTFGTEIGTLADRRFSWGPDGRFTIADTMAPADVTALQAVIAAHDPTKTLPSPPDLKGFLTDVFAYFGGPIQVNAYAVKYPNFFLALQLTHFDNALTLLNDALAKGTVTQAQHDQILAFGHARFFPGW